MSTSTQDSPVGSVKTEVTFVDGNKGPGKGAVTFKDKAKITKTNDAYYTSEISYPRTGKNIID